MKLIGIKRLILLSILIAVNATIAAAYFLWIGPMLIESQNRLNGMKGEISKLQSKIQNTKLELAEYKKNLPAYQALEKTGFMTVLAERLQANAFISRELDAVRQNAELGGFSFQLNDMPNVSYPEADSAKLAIRAKRINLDKVSALLDINFYDFADRMVREFPAHVRLQSLVIDRKEKLDQAALTKIVEKKQVNLLEAKAVFDWLTVEPPKPSAEPAPGERRRR